VSSLGGYLWPEFLLGHCKTPERGAGEQWFWVVTIIQVFPVEYHRGFTATQTEAYAAIRAKVAELSGGSKQIRKRGLGGFAREVLGRLKL
jgi:hypothetical protein